MASNRPIVFRRFGVAGLLALAALASNSPLRAQDHTPDPYKPYNSAYEQFVYPVYPSGSGYVPNQSVLEGRGGYSAANQLQEFMNGSDAGLGDPGYGPKRRGPGVPYYSAHRQYQRDRENPYQARDQEFYKDQEARQEKFMAYLRERDPKKRAELYREYLADSKKVSRDLSRPRSTFGTTAAPRRATTAAAPAGRTAPAGGTTRPGTTGAVRTPATGTTAPSLRSFSAPPAGTRAPAATTRPSDVLRRALGADAQNRSGTRATPSTPPGLPSVRPR